MTENLRIGDVCRVRDWDDMAAERSNNANSFRDIRINLPNGRLSFIEAMRHLCGQVFTIKSINKYAYSDINTYLSVEGIEIKNNGSKWLITADMLERLEYIEEMPEGCTLDLSDLF